MVYAHLWFVLGVAVSIPLINCIATITRFVRSCEDPVLELVQNLQKTNADIDNLIQNLEKTNENVDKLVNDTDVLVTNTNAGVETMELVPIKKEVRKIKDKTITALLRCFHRHKSQKADHLA